MKLQADIINGVYEVESFEEGVVPVPIRAFHAYLSRLTLGEVIGCIESENTKQFQHLNLEYDITFIKE